jgi:hypothetical protein
MARALFLILHALQAAFSGYTLYLSSIAIRHLQKYEETSKKAAKYSNIAEHQLHKTRTTQASGALAVHTPPQFNINLTNSLLGSLLVPLFVDFDDLSSVLPWGLDNCHVGYTGCQCGGVGGSEETCRRVLEGESEVAVAWCRGI